jgi:hypothetical protein
MCSFQEHFEMRREQSSHPLQPQVRRNWFCLSWLAQNRPWKTLCLVRIRVPWRNIHPWNVLVIFRPTRNVHWTIGLLWHLFPVTFWHPVATSRDLTSTPPLEWTLCHLWHHVNLSFLDCDIWSIFLLSTFVPETPGSYISVPHTLLQFCLWDYYVSFQAKNYFGDSHVFRDDPRTCSRAYLALLVEYVKKRRTNRKQRPNNRQKSRQSLF